MREIPFAVLQTTPVLSSVVILQVSGFGYACGALIVLSVVLTVAALGELVRRAEAAADACRQLVQPDLDDPQEVVRAAAKWGSEVLQRVADGETAEQAVAGAVPRMRAPSECGSAVSEHELRGLDAAGSDWMMRAARGVGATPVLNTEMEGLRAAEVRAAARMSRVPEADVVLQPLPGRASCSPPRERLVIGFTGNLQYRNSNEFQ